MEIETLTTPQAIEVREEHGRIMNDPSHPMHAAFLRNDPTVNAHLDAMYAKLVPSAPPLTDSLVMTTDTAADRQAQVDGTALSLEDRVAANALDIRLRQTLGTTTSAK
jgi:hypothetical protein